MINWNGSNDRISVSDPFLLYTDPTWNRENTDFYSFSSSKIYETDMDPDPGGRNETDPNEFGSETLNRPIKTYDINVFSRFFFFFLHNSQITINVQALPVHRQCQPQPSPRTPCGGYRSSWSPPHTAYPRSQPTYQ